MKRVLLFFGKGSAPAATVADPYPNQQTATKEEAFFDSEPWLESDCEDFFSVQGGNTPTLNTSPVRKKKTLRELLSESFDATKSIDLEIYQQQKPEEDLSNTSFKMQKRKSSASARRCFPGLVRSLSCSDWKKRLSPVHIAHC